MKILIAFDAELFGKGTPDVVAEKLAIALRSLDHEVEILRVPIPREGAEDEIKQMLLVENLEIANVDKVIALSFPVCLLRHSNKSVWLVQPDELQRFLNVSAENVVCEDFATQQVRSAITHAFQSLDKLESSPPSNWTDLAETLLR